MIIWILNNIVTGYITSTITFLIIIIFFRSVRSRTQTFLNNSNSVILFCLVCNIIWVVKEAVICKAYTTKNIDPNLLDTYQKNNYSCFSFLICTLIFAFIFQTLFFFKRNRIKVSLTIISILLLTFIHNYERFVIFITSLFRDYIPSSWSANYNVENILWKLVFSIAYFIFCWSNLIRYFRIKN